jgi:Na+/melibiose symporter-like transporter
VGTFGAALVLAVVYTFFYLPWTQPASWVVVLGFVAFMSANGVRNVSYNTLATKVPEPAVRARFQSFQSAVQHGASALAAILSAQLLAKPEVAGGQVARLVGMPTVALVSMGLSLAIPGLLFVVERGVVRQRAAAALVPARPG